MRGQALREDDGDSTDDAGGTAQYSVRLERYSGDICIAVHAALIPLFLVTGDSRLLVSHEMRRRSGVQHSGHHQRKQTTPPRDSVPCSHQRSPLPSDCRPLWPDKALPSLAQRHQSSPAAHFLCKLARPDNRLPGIRGIYCTVRAAPSNRIGQYQIVHCDTGVSLNSPAPKLSTWFCCT